MTEVATEPRPSAAGFAPGTVGITAPMDPERHGVFLTDVLTELGFADPDTVTQAVNWTRQTAGTPESYLLERGVIDERQLSVAIAERNGLDHVDLERFEVDPEALAMIGKSTAARYAALPIAFAVDGALLVAIEDPSNMLGVSDIEVMTRSEVRLVIAAGSQIQRLIGELPEGPPRLAPEPSPLPSEPAATAVEPAPQPDQPEPPAPTQPDSLSERSLSPTSGGEGVDPGLDEIAGALQEKLRDFGVLIDAAERGWRRSAERERALEAQLGQAEQGIAALEESQSKTAAARELANEASEKLVELRGVLEVGPVQGDVGSSTGRAR